MKKISFFIATLLTITILLCACEQIELNTKPSVPSIASSTTSTPPATTPRIPDPGKYDCFSIPDEVMIEMAPCRFDLDEEKVENIIKIRTSAINGSQFFSFYNVYIYDIINDWDYGKIEDILQLEGKTDVLYMFVCESGLVEFANTCGGDQFIDEDFNDQHAFWGTFYEYALAPEKVLPRDAEVYNVLCMREHDDTAAFIGYVTDQGEYLLYGNTETRNIYLIPMEIYYSIITEEMSKWGEPPENVWDLTPYKVEPRE